MAELDAPIQHEDQQAPEHLECRICGGGAEESAPLFYPCKCSGTIRYIHQECLTTWLAHSKKQSCDVCKHPYTFTKVYKPDMPKIIPPTVLIRRLGSQLVASFILGLRAWLVVLVWLVLVPCCTIWVWRLYFWSGEQIAWSFYGPPGPSERNAYPHNSTSPLLDMVFLPNGSLNPYVMSNVTSVFSYSRNLTEEDWARIGSVIGSDIFQGQIVTSMIVVLFLAVFLLREWIMQNAVPGVFAEGLVAGAPPLEIQPLPQPLPPLQPPPEALGALQDPVDIDALPLVVPPPPRVVPNPRAPDEMLRHVNEVLIRNRERQQAEALGQLDRRPPEAPARTDLAARRLEDARRNLQIQLPSLDRVVAKQGEAEDSDNHGSASGSSPSRKRSRWDNGSSSTSPNGTSPHQTGLDEEPAMWPAWIDDENHDVPLQSKKPQPLFQPLPHSANPFAAVETSAVTASSSTAGGSQPTEEINGITKKKEMLKQLNELQAEQNRQIRQLREQYFTTSTDPAADGRRKLNASGSVQLSDSDSQIFTLADVRLNPKSPSSFSPVNSTHPWEASASSFGTFDTSRRDSSTSFSIPSNFTFGPSSSSSASPASKSLEGSAASLSQSNSPRAPSSRSQRTGRSGKGKARESSSPSSAGVDHSTLAEWAATHSSNDGFKIPPNFTFDFTSGSALSATSSPSTTTPELGSNSSGPSASSIQPLFPSFGPPFAPSTLALPPLAPLPLSQPSSATQTPTFSPSPSRRPPLPPTTPINELPPPTPRPGHVVHITPLIGRSNGIPSPLSPGLATYRAPEELGAANDSDYFLRPSGSAAENRPTAENPQTDHHFNDEDDNNSRRTVPLVEDHTADLPPLVPGTPDDVEEREQELAPLPVVIPPVAPPPPAPAPDVNREDDIVAAVQDDDLEGAAEDDVEGAMEAIGMRGPVVVVFQNASLIMVLLDLTIALGIWFPFTIGKIAFIISLRPKRGLRLLNLPIRLVRILTDPFVDLAIWVIRNAFVSFVLPLASWALGEKAFALTQGKVLKVAVLLDQMVILPIRRVFGAMPNKASIPIPSPTQTKSWKDSMVLVWDFVTSKAEISPAFTTTNGPNATSTPTSYLPPVVLRSVRTFMPDDSVLNLDAQLSAVIQQTIAHSKDLTTRFKDWWIHRARGTEPSDRIWAVMLGYIVAALGTGIYLALTSNGRNVGTIGRTIRKVVQQQIIVVKVAVFIMIELVVFPLGCGIILDLNTLPLFPTDTMTTRILFFKLAPFTSLFYHWMLGTMFMYQFAMLLGSCRSIMRSGAMWFIKDPQDPNFHPIRDILDRRTISQLRKLGSSAMMYSIVISVGIGSVLFTIRFLSDSIGYYPLLPLRLNMTEPLSEIPLDLLFMHIVMPPSLHYLRPKKFLRVGLEKWWRWTARQLRLTSYMFGEHHPDEAWYMEDTRPWYQRLQNPFPKDERHLRLVPTRWIRAPNTDALTLPADQPALIQIDQAGHAVSEAGAANILRQNEVSRNADRDPSEDFAAVHIPPYFGYRVILFIVAFWLLGSSLVSIGFATAVHTGRSVVQVAGRKPVHDAYTFTIGFYLIWLIFLLVKEIYTHAQKRMTPQRFAFRALSWMSRVLYLVISLGVIQPILLSLVIDFYVVLPLSLRLSAHPTLPEIRLLEAWVYGAMYSKIGYRMLRYYQPPGELIQAIDRVIANGWRNPNTWAATRDIIGPVGGGLLAMLTAPLILTAGLRYALPTITNDLTAFYYVYPGVFVAAAMIQASQALLTVLSRWAQVIRDSEFLLEVKLSNLEKPAETDNQVNINQENTNGLAA